MNGQGQDPGGNGVARESVKITDEQVILDRLEWFESQGEFTGDAIPALYRLVGELHGYRRALKEIANHNVVAEGEFPDDNCDWHCTATLAAIAKDTLGVTE